MQLLTDLVVIVALSTAVVSVFHWLRVPAIIGFLVTGVLAGPGVFGAVRDVHAVELLAEVGVILLMFTIGLELAPRELLRMRRSVLGGGGLQVLVTLLCTGLISALTGQSIAVSVFAGFLIALSSTAIVLKSMQSSGEIDSPHGRATLGILIFQDIIIVPMMLFTPLLAGGSGDAIGSELLMLLLKSVVVVIAVIVAARYVMPFVLHRISATRNRELFLLFIVAMCFAVAWLTSIAGLSLALGAFLAGLLIADSEYSHQALGNVIPFRDLFTSIFFVSIGMLLDPANVLEHPFIVAAITLIVVLGKLVLAAGVILLLGYPTRTAILTGFSLAQVGEFSFVLSRVGVKQGLLGASDYQLFLAVAILSMGLTPLLMAIAPVVAEKLATVFGGTDKAPEKTSAGRDGLLVIGYGLNGRNLVTAALSAGIPYTVIEMNPDTVRREARAGVNIMFGDATQDAVLLHAGAATARVIVVAISDPAATARITERVRAHNATSSLIVRTRFVSEVPHLYNLGADEVIPEEFETAVEIFARVLRRYLLPRHEIERMIADLRSDGYETFRGAGTRRSEALPLPDFDICSAAISDESPALGETLRTLELRARFGVSVLAIQHGNETQPNPDPDTPIQGGDKLFLLGTTLDLSRAEAFLRGVDPLDGPYAP
ncbi:MAG: cation:proton antiporter [Bacteroidia bacterium]|nr:cation:proton antiporter [Bacteroidia bacterium]